MLTPVRAVRVGFDLPFRVLFLYKTGSTDPLPYFGSDEPAQAFF